MFHFLFYCQAIIDWLPGSLDYVISDFYLLSMVLFRIGEDIDVQAELDSDIYNPEYNARQEFREPVFSPSCIIMLKVYTVDRIGRNLCCVGYGFLPVFIEVGTTNPPSVTSSEVKVCFSKRCQP